MTTMLFRTDITKLYPADDLAMEWLRKCRRDEIVRGEFRRVRSPRQHRMWWKLMELIHGQQEEWPTTESLSKAILCAIGHGTVEKNKSGTMQTLKAKSIAFGNLDQDEFNQIFDRTIKLICERILPGVKSDDLRREIEEMIS